MHDHESLAAKVSCDSVAGFANELRDVFLRVLKHIAVCSYIASFRVRVNSSKNALATETLACSR